MQADLFDQGQNRILGAGSYADFKRALEASGCTKCALSQSRTRIVVDRGNPGAKILFVGEAPGENEDREGRAFVGRAGRLLDELLRGIGLDPDADVLIANVVKCRPPENRAPLQKEAETCLPFLKKQIELVRPRFILLLGATALKHLFPAKAEFRMQGEVGRFFEDPQLESVRFMVLYHPAYLLRDPRQRPAMERHLQAFKAEWEASKLKTQGSGA
jgi:DNA polymerase